MKLKNGGPMTNKIPHSPEKSIATNGITLVYDTFGKRDAEPLLLIQGLSWQMIMWDDDFCRALAAHGYYVIRFDNRDIGRSTKLDAAGVPDIAALFTALMKGEKVTVPYLISDMADDTFGLLDGLEIESAHVVGFSMGGMIGQTMALNRPNRVRTLTSMSSTTGNPALPPPTPEALSVITVPPPSDRAGFIDYFLNMWRILNGRLSVDNTRVVRYAELTYDRGNHTAGIARQIAAINASGSRKDALGSVTVPSLVIHGDADPLLPVACGIDTAEAIPGAQLLIIEGGGHTLPEPVWDKVLGAIVVHTQ